MTVRTAELLVGACETPPSEPTSRCSQATTTSVGVGVDPAGTRPDPMRRRRTLESEDSSYDSDTENPPEAGGSGSFDYGGTTSRQHEDVSRTVSETLGAEFAEYVSSASGPQYASKLEFAVKLGYTEAHVQQALRRLGPQPAQNELLAELVRLGARDCGPSLAVTGDASPDRGATTDDTLRPIVIDGSNVAMSHGNKELFSCRGIQLAVEWFRARGHTDISVFVPSWRKQASRADTPIRDQDILLQLEKERLLFFTPSRNVGGKRMVCYEDRYVLKVAAQTDGVVVSNDNYRDLVAESQDFKRVVEERLLMYTFVNDRFMPPDDPLGRHGPSLDQFLRKGPSSYLGGSAALALPGTDVGGTPLPPACPYGKKCTYGNKCKYYHPERGNLPQKSVTERLAEQARLQLQEVKARAGIKSRDSSPGGSRAPLTPNSRELLKTKSLPPCPAGESLSQRKKAPLSRTKSSVPPILPQDLLEADGGGHLSVAKKLSDPDSSLSAYSLTKSSSPLGASGGGGPGPSSEEALGSNLHRKLQRQLTLNPAYDPRLYQLRLASSGQQQLLSLPTADPGALHRVGSQENMQQHRALGRLSSDSSLFGAQGPWGLTPGSLPTPQGHPEVTRIASAPDSSRQQRSQSSRMQRLCSTSDTRLDAFPQSTGPSASRGSVSQLGYPAFLPSNPWVALPRPTLVAPPCEVPADVDPRYKLYYHLSSIFPEEQVRTVMDLYPEQTNPQKICAAILNMFPKG